MLKSLSRFVRRALDWYIEQTTYPVQDIDLPEGEELCRTCLGDGGWSFDFAGGWTVCPTCGGRGTVAAPDTK